MIHTEPTDDSRLNPGRRIQFIFWSSLLLVVWTVAFPWVARIPAVKSHLQHLEEKGVNADAMFYTELNHCGLK